MRSNIRGAIITLLAVLVMIGAGYYGFLTFMTQVVPNITAFSISVVAVVAGIAVFFNPCSFPLIPAYLTQFVSEKSRGSRRVIYYGIVVSLGLITFNLILGSLIGVLGEGFAKSFALATDSPNSYVLVFRGLVGTVLIGLGLFAIFGRGFHSAFLDSISSRASPAQNKNPTRSYYLYGLGYNLIGIGCAGPILAILTVFAFATGGFLTALLAYIVFSLTMSTLMIFISALAAFGKKDLTASISRQTLKIRRISSIILILVGLFLILSSIFVQQFTGLLFPA